MIHILIFTFLLISPNPVFAQDNTDQTANAQICTKEQADTGTPESCTDESGRQGNKFYRYLFTDEDGQHYCYLSECIIEEEVLSPTPAVPTQQPDIIDQTPDERAIENLNIQQPKEITKNITPVNNDPILAALRNLFGSLLGIIPKFGGLFAVRSQSQEQSELPSEILSKETDPVKLTGESLGQKDEMGVYSKFHPPEIINQIGLTKEVEQMYERSTFPENICPVTGC